MLAIAAVAVTLLLTLTPQRPSTGLTRSVVTAPGHIKIEALAASSGRLTSDRVPNWVVAVATAQKWAITNPSGQPAGQVTGLEVTAGYYVADATLVKIFDEGQYQTPNQPQDVWVVVIEAPPQSGFSAISGNAVINAATRQVVESDFFATLAPKSGPGPSESP
ncbi:MAG: hypothetical protein ACREOA_09615 [Candidatus Dormibacteria bacterium]